MSEEKVLFELRATPDGVHVEIYESPEWQAYHAQRRARRGPAILEICLGPFAGHFRQSHTEAARHRKDHLRRTLDSLQGIYDDLYGRRAESEV